MAKAMRPVNERFWKLVDKTTTPNGCWTWKGSNSNGYGLFGMKINGKWTGYNHAHRVAWEMANGPIPPGGLICHRCNNPTCVRPDHLYLGDKSTNTLDAVRAGTLNTLKGEDNYWHRLTWEQVREIRFLWSSRDTDLSYRQTVVSQRKLAAQFGVSRATIRAVIEHRTWN